MDRDFYSASIPEPTTILGVRLKPLSLGHLLILHRLKSAFVTADEPVTIHDLALSVLVCAASYKEALEVFERRDMPKLFKKWHFKLTGGWLSHLGFRKLKVVDYPEKVRQFSEYLQRGSNCPNYSYATSDSKAMECPTIQIVKVTLMREMGFTEAELMDRPWALCLWDFVTLKAIDGTVKFVNSDTLAEARRVADALQERLTKHAAG